MSAQSSGTRTIGASIAVWALPRLVMPKIAVRTNSAMSTRPRTSVFCELARRDSGMNLIVKQNNAIPIGTLTKKIQRQER